MTSIKIRTQRHDGTVEIKCLLTHPMENGRNRDALGELIPAHFIEQLTIKLNDQVVVTANMAGSIAKNPYFTFRLKAAELGDKLRVSWVDNQGFSDSAEYVIDA